MALGIDRIAMLACGETSIRDVIAFPKNQAARDLMMDAPAPVAKKQLDELMLVSRRASAAGGRRLKPAAALAAALIAAATPAPQPTQLWPGPTLIGVQAHARRLGVAYFTRIAKAHFERRAPAAASRGGRKRTAASGSWTDLDAIYAWLGAHGSAPLFVLQNPRTPDDVPSMVEFAKQAAQRYPRALLELGNEPDNPGQWPGFYPPHASKRLDAGAATGRSNGNSRARGAPATRRRASRPAARRGWTSAGRKS